MKKISLLLVFLLTFSEISIAQVRRGAIQVRLRDNKMLTLVLDGRHFKRYGSSITISDLPEGMHNLKVYYFYPATDPKYRSYRDNKAHAVLIYKGRTHIDGGKMYYCTVDEVYKTMSIRESRTVSIDNSEQSYPITTQTAFSDEKDDYSYDDVDNWDDINTNSKDNIVSYYKGKNRINKTQMEILKSAVDDRVSSSDKIDIIEQYLENKTLMTDEVIELMSWLTFESNKLELAKSCFSKTLDQENYLLVSKALTFQGSKRELEALIFDKANKNNNTDEEGWEDNMNYRRNNLKKEIGTSNLLQDNQIQSLGESVTEKTGDSDKKKLMTQYLADYKMTSNQVVKMLDWLAFEGTRLEFAKWSFNKVVDKENFGSIKSKFNFTSSKKAIDDLVLLKK